MRFPVSPRFALVVMVRCGLFVGCLAAVLGFRAQATLAEASGHPVRIVTFNAEILTAPHIRAGQIQRFRFEAARRDHIERVAGIIEALRPDVLNLVEVTSREAVEMIVEILHEKGLDDYRGYHVESNDRFSGMDVAVITRFEPDRVDGQSIRTFFSEEGDATWREKFTFVGRRGDTLDRECSLGRNALYFITIDEFKLGFLGLHLKSNPEDNYANARRVAEVKIASKVMRDEIIARGYLPIVLGDLNDYDPDVPDRDDSRTTVTTAIRDLKDFDGDRDGPELVNVAMRIVRVKDRYTSHWDRNENGAGDSDDVYTMLDHILLPKELMPYVERVFIARVLDLSTSDHFPVVVDLRLP
jgi:endonuclease/exonuclease/phosphatase family metal-dependent hydrolase